MIAAYADPPYPGCGRIYDEQVETNHEVLIGTLDASYDAWALSTSAAALQDVLAMCPQGVRVCAWVKPWAAFRGLTIEYAWEPVIVKANNRRVDHSAPAAPGNRHARDFLIANPTKQMGLPGAKPLRFAFWIFELLGLTDSDEFVDVFPGTGVMGRAWDTYRGVDRPVQGGLFDVHSDAA